ncbi:MAG: Helix-turn-helix domain protein [bacterium ADurb.BinA186]|nr:MAG: Helix-turn-helix domain protein [bacterium ADurb.BinA186]
MDFSFLTVTDVAKMLHLHPETVRRFIREGKLKAYKIGKSKLLREEDVKKFVSNCLLVDTH